jgi:hypothetical protein
LFQLKDGDVRACHVLADPLVNLDMMADSLWHRRISMRSRCVETENVTTLDLFPPHHRPEPGIVMNQLESNRR